MRYQNGNEKILCVTIMIRFEIKIPHTSADFFFSFFGGGGDVYVLNILKMYMYDV